MQQMGSIIGWKSGLHSHQSPSLQCSVVFWRSSIVWPILPRWCLCWLDGSILCTTQSPAPSGIKLSAVCPAEIPATAAVPRCLHMSSCPLVSPCNLRLHYWWCWGAQVCLWRWIPRPGPHIAQTDPCKVRGRPNKTFTRCMHEHHRKRV